MNRIDTSGLSCPEPVIMTKKALAVHGEGLDVIVDNRASLENVTRYAEALGYRVERMEEGRSAWRLEIRK